MKLAARITILLCFVFLQGCETTNPNTAKLKVTKATMKEVPKWFTKLPKSKKVLYAKGTAISGDLQLSLDKATIAAKRSLAETLDSYISSKTKTFVTETGMDEASSMYSELEQVTINSIKEANIVGFKEYKSKTIGIGSKYRTYYVMEYPIGKANKILISQIKNNALLEGSVKASAAYKDLEKEIQGSN